MSENDAILLFRLSEHPNTGALVMTEKKIRPFSPLLFVIVNTLTLLFFLGLVALGAPSVWKNQFSAPWWSIIATFLGVHVTSAFFEFFFHRYMLHAPIVPGMSRLYRQHDLVHHRITSVGLSDGQVKNVYPITETHQHEASFFPWYSFLGFGMFALPFFMIVQWLLPSVPIFLGGYTSIMWSLFLYEIWHMIEHWPYETWWKPRIENPKWGWLWKKIYLFHVRHHADTKCNEAISGFFGLPLADWFFGTYVPAKISYENGTVGTPQDFRPPVPRFILWLDKIAIRAIAKYRTHNN